MRLLNVSTRELEEFQGNNIPRYVILSHTWGPEEVTLQEMQVISRHHRSRHDFVTHLAPHSPSDADALKLRLLTTMLMAFRGQQSRSSRLPRRLALTNGDDLSPEEDGPSYVFDTVLPSKPTHHFEAKAGYSKIEYACSQAEKDGYRYVWVDTCCIDEKSSADMSEAVNSMFSWYQRAEVCYAYLEDVHFDDYKERYLTWKDHFSNSRWFTRGWTLQELLAPKKLVFYAKGWRMLGTKSSLVKIIEKITGIDELTLLEPRLIHQAGVAQRMSWAAKRETTRTEDLAYSLMGLFGVNMPIIYGEGENAFLRLQEEIIRRSDDHSIFAWGTLRQGDDKNHPHFDLDDLDHHEAAGICGVLAKSPRDFAGMEHIVPSPPARHSTSDYNLTTKGLRINLPLFTPTNPSHTAAFPGQLGTHHERLAILNCHPIHDSATRLALLLTPTTTPEIYLRTLTPIPTLLSPAELKTMSHNPQPTWIYIPTTLTNPSSSPFAPSADEIIFIRARDLLAPGYEVIDIQSAAEQVQWSSREWRLRLGGVGYRHRHMINSSIKNGRDGDLGREVEVLLYQLAVVTFWNGHLGCGFRVRVLAEGRWGRGVWVDLLPVLSGQGVQREQLVEEARRVRDDPGVVEVRLPGPTTTERVVQARVVNPVVVQEGDEEEDGGQKVRGSEKGWFPKPGCEVKVSGSVTFTEKWERDYQRTVNAKVERKKKGVIELSLLSVLWQAAE